MLMTSHWCTGCKRSFLFLQSHLSLCKQTMMLFSICILTSASWELALEVWAEAFDFLAEDLRKLLTLAQVCFTFREHHLTLTCGGIPVHTDHEQKKLDTVKCAMCCTLLNRARTYKIAISFLVSTANFIECTIFPFSPRSVAKTAGYCYECHYKLWTIAEMRPKNWRCIIINMLESEQPLRLDHWP